MLCNALTIDVEDYFHVSAFERVIPRRNWDAFESRVRRNTHRVLRMLDRSGVRATFFVLGWVARHDPALVRDIQRAGHEIGCHSYWHRLVYRMTPEEFLHDLRDAQQAIGDVTGQPSRAYRAPSYSITKQSLWALESLAAEGFQYDSSIYPVTHDRYGIPRAPLHPCRLGCESGSLWEFPLPAYPLLGRNWPVGGGGYLRLLPIHLTVSCLRAINRRFATPFAVTIHPWELDPQQPRLAGSPLSRFRHYVNLHTTEEKLDRLLGAFCFDTLSTAVARYAAAPRHAQASVNGKLSEARESAMYIPLDGLLSSSVRGRLGRSDTVRRREEAA